jgi:hypothetical protein
MSANVTRARPARSFATAIAATLCSAVLLTGCGGDDSAAGGTAPVGDTKANPDAAASEPASTEPYAGMEPADILKKVADTTAAASSVQIEAVYKEDSGDVTFNMRFIDDGRAKGTMLDENSGTMKLVAIKQDGYFQLNKDFIKKAGGDPSSGITKKWAKIGPKSDMSELFSLLNKNAFLNDLLDLSAPADGLKQVKGKKFAGRETIGLKVEGTPGTVFVAADGSGEMVAYQHPDRQAVFTNWNKKMKIKAPPNAVTEAQLYGGL